MRITVHRAYERATEFYRNEFYNFSDSSQSISIINVRCHLIRIVLVSKVFGGVRGVDSTPVISKGGSLVVEEVVGYQLQLETAAAL